MSKTEAELLQLRAENYALKALLAQHGIAAPESVNSDTAHIGTSALQPKANELSSQAKVKIFRRLFRGREDIYPVRWISKTTGKSGYSPDCANKWRPGICKLPTIKCNECSHSLYAPVTDQIIRRHLIGEITAGVYPLLVNNRCYFLAIDFDEADWREDARAVLQTCIENDLPAALEISRSGEGAHLWLFFATPTPARDVRRLGAALISATCARTRQLTLKSYDRLFPNQDIMPKGGFGNLIALPLQKEPRELGRSVFVDANLQQLADQWAFLDKIKPLAQSRIETALTKLVGDRHPLDIAYADVPEENADAPWVRPAKPDVKLNGIMPKAVKATLASQLFIEKAGLPQTLMNRLIRIAAFQNPDYYKLQAAQRSTWNTPRIISRAENHEKFLSLPLGCLSDVEALLAVNKIELRLDDARSPGQRINATFNVAVIQSLAHRNDLPELFSQYGQVIIDEAHHLTASTFEAVLKQASARYVLGLSATPVRSNGHHPIIFMQSGPVRHIAKRPTHVPDQLMVRLRHLLAPSIPQHASIQEVIRLLSEDSARNARIVADATNALKNGRKVLLLTKRTEHLALLHTQLAKAEYPCFMLHGRMKAKERQAIIKALADLPEGAPHILLASGQLVGEGFDHAPLDTLILTLPISWTGTLQQYAGRLHRDHAHKSDILIYDYVELDHPQLYRMWEKRQRGYRAMGYKVDAEQQQFRLGPL